MKILLVEDDKNLRGMIKIMIESFDHQCIDCHDGKAALSIFQEVRGIAVLVTDHYVPGMTGLELIAEIRKIKPNFPVIMISAYLTKEDVPKDVISFSKPFERDALEAALKKIEEAQK